MFEFSLNFPFIIYIYNFHYFLISRNPNFYKITIYKITISSFTNQNKIGNLTNENFFFIFLLSFFFATKKAIKIFLQVNNKNS